MTYVIVKSSIVAAQDMLDVAFFLISMVFYDELLQHLCTLSCGKQLVKPLSK